MALREFQLKYGKGFVSFKIPQEEILYELEGKDYPALADLQQTYRFALDHPIDSPPLAGAFFSIAASTDASSHALDE